MTSLGYMTSRRRLWSIANKPPLKQVLNFEALSIVHFQQTVSVSRTFYAQRPLSYFLKMTDL